MILHYVLAISTCVESNCTGSRSQETPQQDIFVHLLLRKYVNTTPITPVMRPITVITKVECFSSQSGSGHAALTHSMLHVVIPSGNFLISAFE